MLIKNARQMLTMTGDKSDGVALLENAWLYVEDGVISKVADQKDMQEFLKDKPPANTTIDATNKTVLPGFVDSHTHIVFGGSRVFEYVSSITGNKDKINAMGLKTGIYATTDMTNSISVDELVAQTEKRMRNMILSGTTTIESKSGYSLYTDGEIRMLQANKRLADRLPIEIISTFLGAHGWPQEMKKEDYIKILTEEMIPKVAEMGLAKFCDIWCDDGHYTAKESEIVLRCGEKHGMLSKIHTDAYSYVGGSDLAVEMGMVSADHLNYTPASVIERMVEKNVVGVVLPAIEFAVKHKDPVNIRQLLDMGMSVAVATNCCPGAWVESMHFVLVLAARQYNMTPEEALYSATASGAAALRLEDRGRLKEGMKADIQIWDVDSYEDIFYKYYNNPVETVIKDGVVTVNNGEIV